MSAGWIASAQTKPIAWQLKFPAKPDDEPTLEQFDAWVPDFERAMAPEDLAIFTADHGCDPTTPSTDHSREYVPVLVHGAKSRRGVDLGLRASLSDIGQTVAGNFGTSIVKGKSFLPQII